jgi:hypothetical protein
MAGGSTRNRDRLLQVLRQRQQYLTTPVTTYQGLLGRQFQRGRSPLGRAFHRLCPSVRLGWISWSDSNRGGSLRPCIAKSEDQVKRDVQKSLLPGSVILSTPSVYAGPPKHFLKTLLPSRGICLCQMLICLLSGTRSWE